MNLASFESEVRLFLHSNEPEVLVISGKWGVGKTHGWDKIIKDPKLPIDSKFKTYAYVSLFGLGGLRDLKDAVLYNTVAIKDAGKSPDIKSLGDHIQDTLKQWRKGAVHVPRFLNWAMSKSETLEGFGTLSPNLAALFVKDQIVCIDDLERKSRGLEVRDILGFVSELKEQKKCKVVILLNDEELGDVEADFKAQLEKVADTFLRFAPSPAEAADLVSNSNQSLKSEIVDCCTKLGLINIRTVKRIEKAVVRVDGSLGCVDPRIIAAAVRTLSILTFSKYHPLEGPSLSYLKGYSGNYIGAESKAIEIANPQWRTLVSALKFVWESEFTDILANSVFDGYLDEEALAETARAFEAKVKLSDKSEAYHQAWQLYHWSIEDDCELVLEKFEAAIRKMADVISPTDFDGTIITMRELGWKGDFSELISAYVDARSNEAQSFWENSIEKSGQSIKDIEVSKAYQLKAASYQEQLSAKDALMLLADGWNSPPVEFLARQSLNEIVLAYRELSVSGTRDLKLGIQGGLKYRNVGNRSQIQDIVNTLIIEALSIIAQDNPLNAMRLARHGIPPTAPPS